MESDTEGARKARFRFGFSGKRKRVRHPERRVVSKDDILDSLTRQAASQMGLGERQTQRLQLLTETEEERALFSEPTVSTIAHLGGETNRRLGHYAIVLMGVGGMILVWLYGSGRGLFDTSLLNSVFQKTGVQPVFTNPAQVGIVSVIALITALWVALRRRASRILIPI